MKTPITRSQGPRHPASETHAFVTFLMLNDNYLPGALTLGYSLRHQQLPGTLVCLITTGVSPQAQHALEQIFDRVLEVELVYVPHVRRQERQDRPYFFTRLNALRLGRDGDLGCHFEKIVVIDADVLPIRDYDSLFGLSTPAGIINERKSHFVEVDDSGTHVIPETVKQDGTWVWHRLYGKTCPHGKLIPAGITDRVAGEPGNMGINGSLFVLEPSMDEFCRILADVERPEVQRLVGDLFDWPDMQYMTMRWSGQWTSIDARYSGLSGYPDLSVLCGTHFAGFKPWYFNRRKAMMQYARFADFQLWFQVYEQMVTEGHPQLLRFGKLERLLKSVRQLKPFAD